MAANASMEAAPDLQDQIVVRGTVTDDAGVAIIGAAVMVKGQTVGVVTDLEGAFEINAEEGQTLQISYLGFQTVSVRASASPMQIRMQEDTESLDEVVVVGYGTSKRRDLIASVSTVKTEEISNIPVTNVTQGLAGRSPGLIVQASGGGVNSTPTVSIRGGGDPIYVIDGVIRTADDFANLLPDDIETMSILKDASATAVYGSRASNGIIQVTTKGGKEGKPTVEYDFNYSLAQPSIWPDKLDSYTRATYANTASLNDGGTAVYSDSALQAFKDGSDPLNYNNTDWRKLVLKSWAPQQKHTVRVTGGDENNRYYASLGHIYQNSLYKSNTHYMHRTNFRLSESSYIKKINLHINVSLDGYTQKTTHPYTSTASSYYTVFSHINDRPCYLPGVNKYGLPYNTTDNPVAETASDAGYNRQKENVVNGKGELVWDVYGVEGLKIRLSSDYRYFSNTTKQWRKDAAQYDWDSTDPQYANTPLLYHSSNTGYSFTNQAFVEYGNTFGKHTVSALAGYEQYYEKEETYWEQREDYEFDIDQISVGSANTMTNGGSEAELGRSAFIAQVKYNYANRYYIEGSLRYDGSDYFAPGHRWGAFFSGSIGWVMTEEKFMRNVVDKNIFNMLKLRASYGETGLDSSAGRFAYLTSYSLDTQGYVVDGKYTSTFTEGDLPSPDLTWYTTKQTDFGFDFASLNSRLYGSFDYFYYSTKGYLVSPTGESYLNTALGIGMPKVKSDSQYRRAGYEVTLGWKDTVGDFRYDISGNFVFFDELWAYDASEAESSYMNPYQRTQQTKGYYDLLYKNAGYYKNAQDVYNSVAYVSAMNTGYLTAGDIKYVDTNGDGKIDSSDMRRLGKSSVPRGQFGLNVNMSFKGFYLSMLFQGSTSFDMYISGTASMQTGQNWGMPVMYDYQTDFWTPSNTNAQYPRLMANTGLNSNNNYLSSDFWLVNGAYLRMKDFQFGYDFKYSVLRKSKWLSRLKVGISGQNLFTISQATKYGLDPENSSTTNYGYPVERIIAFTLNIGF